MTPLQLVVSNRALTTLFRTIGIIIKLTSLLAFCQPVRADQKLSEQEIKKLVELNLKSIHVQTPDLRSYKFLIQLQESFEDIKDFKLKGDAAYILGHYYVHIFDAENGVKYFAKSIEMYRQANEWGLYLNSTKDFCNASWAAGNTSIIEPTLRKALEVPKHHNVGFFILDPLQELMIHFAYTTGSYSEAIKYGQMYMDTLQKYQKLNIEDREFEYSRTFDKAIVELELGHSYLALGQLSQASHYLQKAETFFLKEQDPEKLSRVYKHLSVLAGRQKKINAAIDYLNKFDKYLTAYQRFHTAVLYKVPRVTRDLQSLNEKYLESQKKVEHLTKQTYYIIALFILAGALALFSFWTQRKSRLTEKKINELLRRDFERSQHLNDEKVKYFSILSHELRTPIFAITGLAKLLSSPAGNTQENVDAIINSGDHLLHLVNNVLQHNKLEESGHVTLDEVDFELQQTLTEVLQTTSYLANQKSIDILFDNQLNGPQYINGDKQKLAQILVNLISNAIRYSPRNSVVEVEVRCQACEGSVRQFHFSIRDHGIGIDSTQLPLLFDYRKTTYDTDMENDGTMKGMGIGLFVVAKFVTSMGSEIKVESKPGVGSNFYFELTFKPGVRLDIPVKPLQRTFEDITVLVVDDIKINLIVTQKTLKTIGVKCITATDADPVVDIITTQNIDLVLMDLNMPLINGYDLSKAIRKAGIMIPIVAHTAVIRENIDHHALRDADIHDYLIKPYPIEELKEKLTHCLNVSF